jgi:hypothetical protein
MSQAPRYHERITTEVYMFRKVALTSLAAVMVAGTLIAIPANAATKVSNGVACSKSGATTKSGGTTYRCAKNPLVKNAKLTWVARDCINLAASYNKSRAALPTAKAQTDATIAQLDLDLAKWKVEADKAVIDIANYEAKILVIKDALAKAKADTANAAANRTKIMQYETGIRNFETAIRAKGIFARNLTRTEAAKKNAAGTYQNFVAEVDIALSMAKIVCARGN